jgi:hypothetical protein
LIQIEYSSEKIADISDFDTSYSDERPDSHLHEEPKKWRDSEFAFSEHMESVEDAYERYDSAADENNNEFLVGEISEDDRKKGEIDIECSSDFERKWGFSFFVRIFMWLIHEAHFSIESHDEKKNHWKCDD